MRCPLNLNSHNHNQRDGRRRFYLAFLRRGQFHHRARFFPCSEIAPHPSANLRLLRAHIARRGIGRRLSNCTHPSQTTRSTTIRQINDETAQILGVQPSSGAIVIYVADKSPAKRAGIVSGDVIVKLNGIDISEFRDVPRVMADIPPGKSVPVVFIRERNEIAATVMFGTTAQVRTPTCEELFSYANLMPPDAIDRSFSKGSGDLNVNDFDDALAIVSRCREAVAPPPLDRRHVPTERNGKFQLNVLSILSSWVETV